MSDIGNKLMGEGFVDEGIAFEEMEAELAKLKKLLASKKNVCSKCQTELVARQFEGYYDSFAYWECNCETLENAVVCKGAYA